MTKQESTFSNVVTALVVGMGLTVGLSLFGVHPLQQAHRLFETQEIETPYYGDKAFQAEIPEFTV